MKNIEDLILRNDINKVAILPHLLPDGDTIGSAIALKLILSKLGKEADIYFATSIPSNLDFLAHLADYKKETKPLVDYDLCIAVDCSNLDRIEDRLEIFKSAKITAVIDHHSTNELFADYNYVESDSASTGEIIFQLAKNVAVPLDSDIAIAIHTAMVTDTGSFQYSSTTKRSFTIASELMEIGFDFELATQKLFQSLTFERVNALRQALNNLELFENGKVAYTRLSYDEIEELGLKAGDSEGITEYLRSIKGVEVALFLRDVSPHSIKVSMRSKSSVNVADISILFSGGGHARAAGFSTAENADSIRAKLLNEVKKQL